MKRKVIQLAGKTHVVSLPSKWVRKYSVKKGDEVNLVENGNEVIIQAHSETPEYKKITISLNGAQERIARWTLSALHKKGYDEIEVLFDDDKFLDILDDLLKNLFLGFAIVRQSKKTCTIKSISKEQTGEFSNILRRAFYVTIDFAKSARDALAKGDKETLARLVKLEKTNNQLTNFCQRIINKGLHTKDPTFYYVIAWNLEKVADDYKYICEDLQDSEEVAIGQDIISYWDDVIVYLEAFMQLFYKFDMGVINGLDVTRKELISRGKLLIRGASKDERILVFHLLGNVMKIADFHATTIAMNTV